MRRILILILLLLCVLVLLFLCTASARAEMKSDTLEVYFHQGKSVWDPNFKNNAERMSAFADRIVSLQKDTTIYKITKIHIVSGASPEGYLHLNKILSDNRAKTIRRVLKSYVSLPDSMIVEDSRGINWEGLEQLVAASDMEYKDEVLHHLHTAPEFMNNLEVRKLRLIYLRDGKPWKYMYEHFFPKLRSFNLQIVFEWEKYVPATPEPEPIPELEPLPEPEPETNAQQPEVMPEISPVVPPVPVPVEPAPFYMAVKSNLLFDALLTPNIGLEFYLGNNFAITGNWMYAWWNDRGADWWHRIYGGDLEVRKYFGSKADEKPLQGWHAGLYGQMVTYDFEMGNRGYLADRWSWGAGASLGYSLPIMRHFNLDFTLGVGYLGGKYKEYLPIDGCYVWQCTKNRNWIGITKAEITLVWLLGRGNYNEKTLQEKGGAE